MRAKRPFLLKPFPLTNLSFRISDVTETLTEHYSLLQPLSLNLLFNVDLKEFPAGSADRVSGKKRLHHVSHLIINSVFAACRKQMVQFTSCGPAYLESGKSGEYFTGGTRQITLSTETVYSEVECRLLQPTCTQSKILSQDSRPFGLNVLKGDPSGDAK